MSLSPRQHTDNGKYNGSHKGTSTHKNNVNGSVIHNKKEKGVVEKLLNSYGFIECASSGSRVFFHYSEYDGDPNDLMFGGKCSPTNNAHMHMHYCHLPCLSWLSFIHLVHL